jgi:hypothetical protein
MTMFRADQNDPCVEAQGSFDSKVKRVETRDMPAAMKERPNIIHAAKGDDG